MRVQMPDGSPLPCSFPTRHPAPLQPHTGRHPGPSGHPHRSPCTTCHLHSVPFCDSFLPVRPPKAQRWEDSSPSAAGSEGPPSPPPRPSYRDVVASRPILVERGPPPAKTKPSSCRVLTSVVGHCSISLLKTNDDGWHKVESRRAHRRRLPRSHAHCQRFSEDLQGKCFNCLSVDHRAASCRRPTCCFRCFC
jgi:hypothetical protein